MDRTKLPDLHDALAQTLTSLVKAENPSAAVLREAREFLRDNGITVKVDAPAGKPVRSLLGEVEDHEFPFRVVAGGD